MLFFFFFTFKESTFCPTPSQQNNLTGVFSTASKTRSQLILTWSQQFISVIMSCSHCKTGFARLALSRPPPGASGGGFLRQGHRSRDSSGARRPDGGDGGRHVFSFHQPFSPTAACLSFPHPVGIPVQHAACGLLRFCSPPSSALHTGVFPGCFLLCVHVLFSYFTP